MYLIGRSPIATSALLDTLALLHDWNHHELENTYTRADERLHESTKTMVPNYRGMPFSELMGLVAGRGGTVNDVRMGYVVLVELRHPEHPFDGRPGVRNVRERIPGVCQVFDEHENNT